MVIVVLSATQALQEAGLGIAIAAMHSIGPSLGVGEQEGQLSWFAASYALTVGTFVLPSGRLGDTFGHRRILIIGWSWFALWSVITGLSMYVAPSSLCYP